MHAMLLLANAAGLAFVPHLRHLLGLAQGMLLSGAECISAVLWRSSRVPACSDGCCVCFPCSCSCRVSCIHCSTKFLPGFASRHLQPAEEAYCLPGLLPAAGRLANAAVELLGPDYTFGSAAYLTCKSIINDMRALGEGGESGGGVQPLGAGPLRQGGASCKLNTALKPVLLCPQARQTAQIGVCSALFGRTLNPASLLPCLHLRRWPAAPHRRRCVGRAGDGAVCTDAGAVCAAGGAGKEPPASAGQVRKHRVRGSAWRASAGAAGAGAADRPGLCRSSLEGEWASELSRPTSLFCFLVPPCPAATCCRGSRCCARLPPTRCATWRSATPPLCWQSGSRRRSLRP